MPMRSYPHNSEGKGHNPDQFSSHYEDIVEYREDIEEKPEEVLDTERSPHMRRIVILLGPTAVGKTDYSIELAQHFDSPIISCDSRQLFRQMSIGTAVPSPEQLSRVKHYFIHSHSVEQYYTAGKYEVEALVLVEELFRSHETLIMTGGSGLYIDAFCKGLDDFPKVDHELRQSLTARLKRGVGISSDGVENTRPRILQFHRYQQRPASNQSVGGYNWHRT